MHTVLLDLPSDVLLEIFSQLPTPSFMHLIHTCRKLFYLASTSREVLVQHLSNVPGVKWQLYSLSKRNLFLLIRQRAAESLYGVEYSADCCDYRYQDTSIRSNVSCLSPDSVHIFLALKEISALLVYSNRFSAKYSIPSPFTDGKAQILHMVQSMKNYLSVLYAWYHEEDVIDTFPGIVNPTSRLWNAPNTTYHLLHHDLTSHNRPVCFRIPPMGSERSLVPVHLAVHNRLSCAIIWDKAGATSHRSSSTEVVHYYADRLPSTYEEGSYEYKTVAPILDLSEKSNTKSSEWREWSAHLQPRSVAFFKSGRRLKLYCAGSVVPYSVISTARIHPAIDLSNETRTRRKNYTVDTPFFGKHYDKHFEETATCYLSYLSLALTTNFGHAPTLCIISNLETIAYEECQHCVNLDCMPHRSTSPRVVAVLRDWEVMTSTIPGSDSICTSPKGARIAIAMWDSILVYHLNPHVLCEYQHRLTDEYGSAMLGFGQRDYYDRIYDLEYHATVVDLKPTVLKLDGSVPLKMMWGTRDFEQNDTSLDESDGSQFDHSDPASVGSPGPVDLGLRKDDVENNSGGSVASCYSPSCFNAPAGNLGRPGRSQRRKKILDLDFHSDGLPDLSNILGTSKLDDSLESPRPEASLEHRSRTATDSSDDGSRGYNSPGSVSARRRKRSRQRWRNAKKTPKRKREDEDELIVLTDRGVQFWDLSVWGCGRRLRFDLDDHLLRDTSGEQEREELNVAMEVHDAEIIETPRNMVDVAVANPR